MAQALTSVIIALALLALPGAASAQEESSPPTYQDTTGVTWSVATLEVGLLLAAVAVAASDDRSAQAVGVLALGASVVAAAVAAGVAQGLGAPVEPPMVFHQGLIGGALLGGLMSFSLRAAGERGDLPAIFGVGGLIVGAALASTYSVLRMERLAHDPELLEEAHVLSWAPVLGAGLLTALLTAVGLTDGAGVIGALVGLVGLGIAISLVEVAIAENPRPDEDTMGTGAPLVAF